jgi:hypothetical protein
VVWNQTISGTINYHASRNPGEDVLFKMTLDDTLGKLLEDREFARVLLAH